MLNNHTTGGTVVGDYPLDEFAYEAQQDYPPQIAERISISTEVAAFGALILGAFAAGACIYLLYFVVDGSYNGGDKGQWRHIDSLDVNVSSIWTYLQEQFACMTCAAGVLTTGDAFVNGSLLLKNNSDPPANVLVALNQLFNYTWQLSAQNALLAQQLQQLNQTVSQKPAAMRLEVENFQTIFSTEPDTQFVPFTGTGFYGYNRDPSGLFDTSNDNYTIVTRNAIVQASAQVYFSANSTESYLVCFFMPFTNSTPGAEPTLMAGISESGNITAFGGFPYVGVITMVGSFSAQAGWELNIRCAIAQGTPLEYIVNSHLDLLEVM